MTAISIRFSLRQKLAVITENSPYYSGAGNRSSNPWRRPIIPMEGPLFVDEEYEIEREVVALSGSRRTESAWVKSRVFDKTGAMVATMLLNMATLKDSYAPYEEEYQRLYGAGQ